MRKSVVIAIILFVLGSGLIYGAAFSFDTAVDKAAGGLNGNDETIVASGIYTVDEVDCFGHIQQAHVGSFVFNKYWYMERYSEEGANWLQSPAGGYDNRVLAKDLEIGKKYIIIHKTANCNGISASFDYIKCDE
jgi:hypothetical protein